VFWVVFLASVVTPFNQYKVPPLIPVLLTELNLTEIEAGLLMSVFSLSGLVLAFPAGLLFRRFGPVLVGTIALGFTGLGAAVGALAEGSGPLLFGRLLEGIGMGVIAVLALVTIAAWFPPHRRGLPMGIFTAWIPLGQLMVFLVAPPLNDALGWRAVWWLGSAAAFGCALLFATLVRLPANSQMARPSQDAPPFTRVLREPGPWLLAAFFASFHITRAGFGTWTPTYLVTEHSWSLGDAASLVSLFYLVSVPLAIPAGWLIDHVPSRRRAFLWATLLSTPAYAVSYAIDPSLLVLAIIWSASMAAIIPCAVNAATPETTADRSLVGPAAGVVALGRNGGQLLAPLMIAPIVQAGLSWNWVAAVIVGVAALGMVAGAFVRDPAK
jgi:MFS family permease